MKKIIAKLYKVLIEDEALGMVALLGITLVIHILLTDF